jgi:hypothetical protein
MSSSANDATRRLRAMVPKRTRCRDCRLLYHLAMMHTDNQCVHCYLAQQRIRDAAETAAEYIKQHGQEAWDAQLAEKIKELY